MANVNMYEMFSIHIYYYLSCVLQFYTLPAWGANYESSEFSKSYFGRKDFFYDKRTFELTKTKNNVQVPKGTLSENRNFKN